MRNLVYMCVKEGVLVSAITSACLLLLVWSSSLKANEYLLGKLVSYVFVHRLASTVRPHVKKCILNPSSVHDVIMTPPYLFNVDLVSS